MNLFVAVTSGEWIEKHRSLYESGLTDWWKKPGSRKFRKAAEEDLFFFKPQSAWSITGWARVVRYVRGPASRLWDEVPRDHFEGETWRSRAQVLLQISGEEADRDPEVSSVILFDCTFLADGQDLALPKDYLPNLEEGRKYENAEADPLVAHLIKAATEQEARPDFGSDEDDVRPKRRPAAGLLTDAYTRCWPENIREISPLHKRLALRFHDWLKQQGCTDVALELDYVDVRFRSGGRAIMAELKVCSRFPARKAIREALGQVLEYNLYYGGDCSDEWWIVLDERPDKADEEYLQRLRKEFRFPLFLAYEDGKNGFRVLR